MKKIITTTTAFTALFLAMYVPLNAGIIVTTTKSPEAEPPTILNDDLGQTAFGSTTSTGTISNSADDLFTGILNSGSWNDTGATRISGGASFTLNFDLTDNPDGFDIASITSIAGWNTQQGGRSNQGYGIELFFVGGGSGILQEKTSWEPNDPAEFWTTVTHSMGDGSALSNGTVTATGVSAIRFFDFDSPRADPNGGRAFYREFDIVAVPEPSTIVLFGIALGSLVFLRRRK
ncbi:MAG: PEP-CTERM sorting domain-containing protein [Verrucomicrobia bacterium]|nr:PEP-CTERM sorting domain-containing protein [Verrucomicrobiota bacterium]MCH8528635.1 PEP-CTERM sorting domain-containing protein [Kiritimatiellia bacterium]